MRFDKSTLDYDKLAKALKTEGYAVIENFYDKSYCDSVMDHIVSSIENLGSKISRNNMKTWIAKNLPPQTRTGMFQAILSGQKDVWTIRQDQELETIWHELYKRLKSDYTDSDTLTVSIDGLNIKPNKPPFYSQKKPDWAHLDQTIRGDPYKCIQGQVVLTNTTAAFRCSPKSHLVFEDILDEFNIGDSDKSNWLKISGSAKEKKCRELVSEWQTPILAPAGSVILWLSTTIHSAKYADKKEDPDSNDVWKGWRGVLYICYRPTKEFTKVQLKRRSQNIEDNRTMNHWSTRTFPKNPVGRHAPSSSFHSEIAKLIENPELFYDLT